MTAWQLLYQMGIGGFKDLTVAWSRFHREDVAYKVVMVVWSLFLLVAVVCRAPMEEWFQFGRELADFRAAMGEWSKYLAEHADCKAPTEEWWQLDPAIVVSKVRIGEWLESRQVSEVCQMQEVECETSE